ncbi:MULTISPECIES: hypothetical protein [Methylobacterium]|uniref:Uncharacterized protein n=2 Tax=Pseudomonadota TaxID=1224 RepID=A0ABQ4SPR9_9HYPH|nr:MULTISPECIES: hypothetical protein [Methylobacterium]PIU07684.1 MAG: hypothetical protein COT56_03990 [Methylobacterium sp. CG09_land_8_20_14_0_10_71_15]PIU11386.1 MAG: hypothetical protein COT28_20105 [Methylobacterium sp. CG08_land_8_20_14_0_20_71_15]GBU18562.1 hypothetical protein AwMethylo_27770 [Methylobacterium sp.]GJE05152.1 hypothetical protein AOPFMNJM_0449 [Methylobacterium jeotgali]
MPVFDAKTLDSSFEGSALLAAILHPTRAAQARAKVIGRRRAARAPALVEPVSLESRFPLRPDALAMAPNETI